MGSEVRVFSGPPLFVRGINIKNQAVQNYLYSSPIGDLKIQLKNNKIYSISKSFSSVSRRESWGKAPRAVQKLKLQLDSYFSGQKMNIKNLPLSFRGTDFQNKVWKCLMNIPYGKTLTYSEVALKIGIPTAPRAVGTACGKNPWLLVVPCHRVVSKNGIGGFSIGLKTKSWLLHQENQKETL